MVFKTLFVNKSKIVQGVNLTPYRIYNLGPGTQWQIETEDPNAGFARWEKIQWLSDGVSIKCTERENWLELDPLKKERWVTEFLNEKGAPLESIVLSSTQTVTLQRGIPVRQKMEVEWPLARFKFYRITTRGGKRKLFGGYSEESVEIFHEKIERSKSELKELEREREKIQRKRIEEELERRKKI